MRKIIFFCCLLSIFPALMMSQNWSRLGANKLPSDPNNLMSSWGPGGIRNIGNGQVLSVWIDPANANHILIGTFGGGIYETFDGLSENLTSIHWQSKTQNLPVHNVAKIVKSNGVLYASSGFYLQASNLYYSNAKESRKLYGLGIIKSNDNGATWQISNMPNTELGFYGLDFTEPTNSGVMYAVSRHKIYKSVDFGDNWTDLNISFTQEGLTNKIFTNIVVHPSNPNVVFVSTTSGTDGDEKVFKSNNGGVSWAGLGTFFNYSLISSYNTTGGITSLYKDGADLYIGFNKNNYNTTVIKSSDWTNFALVGNYSTPFSYSSPNYIKAFGKNFLYGMTSLIQLNSTGNTNLTYEKTHDDIRGINFITANGLNYIFTGHDGGISRSKDGGATWQNIMGDLNIPLINNLGYYTDPQDRAFDIGCQDTGWYRNEITSPPSESFVTKSYEGAVYTSMHNKRIYFENGYYSDNNGITLTPFSGIMRGMIEDPLDYRMRYHTNYGNQFYVYNNNMFSGNLFPNFAITPGTDNIGVQPKVALNSNKNILLPIMYFTTGGYNTKHGLIFSRDRGITWEDVGQNIKNADVGLTDVMNYSGAMLTCVTMDDYHPNRMWAVFAGSGLINQKVYESNDYGKTWQNISFNLSDMTSLGLPAKTPNNYPVNQVEFDENRDVLFIGTDYGLLYLDKTITPNQWKIYGTGLPRSIVTNIFIDDYYNEIVIGTAGNGMYSAPLTDCKDVLISQNTIWTGQNKTICGDLRVKHDIILNISNSNITSKNIILEPGAKIIWDGGSLSSSNSNGNKSFVIGSRDSYFTIKNITVNNYIVNNFEDATLQTGNLTLNNTMLNAYDGSFYDNIDNTLLTLNDSSLNFYSSYYYKTHNVTGNLINSNYYSGLEKINITGNGKINVYDQNISIQNDNLYNRITPVVNTGNYLFESNDRVIIGNNINSSVISGDVNLSSKVEIVAKNFINLEKGTILNPNSYLWINNLITSNLTTPYSRFGATDSQIQYGETEINWITNKNEEDERSEINYMSNSVASIIEDDIKIYPLPIVTHLNYQINEKDLIGKKAAIISNDGRTVKTIHLENKGKIDFTNVPTGVYYFVVESEKGRISKKIIKQGLTDNNPDFIKRKNN